jgi:hypothetical protein
MIATIVGWYRFTDSLFPKFGPKHSGEFIMMRCINCILPENYPGISFDEKGVCSVCQSFLSSSGKKRANKEADLEKILSEAKNNGTDYDVIVPWSGGKDSTYVLFKMVKTYRLKVLALNYNNGFQSEGAVRNLTKVSEKLGVDLISIKPNWNLMQRMYRTYLKHSGEFCTVCNMVGYTLLLSYAKREFSFSGRIPLLIGGWSASHEAQRDIHTFDYCSFAKVIDKEHGLLEAFEQSPLIDRSICEFLRNAGDPRVAPITKKKYSIQKIQLPDYLEWNPHHISEILEREVGYQIPEGSHDTHFDCVMHPVMAFLSTRKWGFAQNTISYAAMVRRGEMPREKALLLLDDEDEGKEPAIMKDFLCRLDIKREEINYGAQWYTGDNTYGKEQ